MGKETHIEWAHSTANPWTGCRRVSPGCANCYMFAWKERHGKKGTDRERTKSMWKDAIKWNRDAGLLQDDPHIGDMVRRPRIFPSLCDWLDDEVPIDWFADFLKLIHDTPNLDWLLLTKRPQNFERIHAAMTLLGSAPSVNDHYCAWMEYWYDGYPPENVWLGVSVEDQKRADERIPLLLKLPAKIRFLSVEPLLESVNLDFWYDACEEEHGPYPTAGSNKVPTNELNWVIVGGESGAGRRDCGVKAIEDIVVQCRQAGVPCFVKQDSAFKPGQKGRLPDFIWAVKEFPNAKLDSK